MKKLISIVCIVALLVTSIGLTFMNVAAAPITEPVAGDTVFLATFTDDEGNDWYPYGPSDAPVPGKVVTNGEATVVKNTSGLPFTGLFSIPTVQTKSVVNISFDWIELEGYNGIMLYVEAPVKDGGYNISMMLDMYNKSINGLGYAYRSYSTGMYYRALGATAFTSAATGGYTSGACTLPSGFKGYVYYNFANMTSNSTGWTDATTGEAIANTTSGNDKISTEDSIRGLRFALTATENEDLVIGTPMLIKGEFNTTNSAPVDTITVGGLTYDLNGSGLIVDDSDYVKPNFTGLTTATAPATLATTTGLRYTVSAIDSITPLISLKSTSHPQVSRYVSNSINQDTNRLYTATITEDMGVNITATGGYMFYIDTSAYVSPVFIDMTVRQRVNTNATATISGPHAVSNGVTTTPQVYYFSDDAVTGTTWQTIDLPTYRPTSSEDASQFGLPYPHRAAALGVCLPTSFKGYLFIPAKGAFTYDLTSSSVWRNPGSLDVYMVAHDATDANKFFKISAPMIVSDFDSSSAIINGDECVLDLDTNKKISANDYFGSDAFYGDKNGIYVPSAPTIVPAPRTYEDVIHPLTTVKVDGSANTTITTLSSAGRTNSNISIIDGEVPIMNIPSVKIATKDTFTAGQYQLVGYSTQMPITRDSGFVLYVKNYDNVAKTMNIPNMKIPANNTDNPYPESMGTSNFRAYRNNNDNYIKMLDVNNDNYWQNVDVSGTTFNLPENFEGYIYFNFEGFSGISALLADSETYAEYLRVESCVLWQNDLAAGQTISVSLPMLATGFSASGYVSPVAYVNDADVPQNIASDNFAIPYDHNGDMKVDVLDLVRAKAEETADYAILRQNYLSVAVDAQKVVVNP